MGSEGEERSTVPPSRAFERLTARRRLSEIFESRLQHTNVRGRDGVAGRHFAANLAAEVALISDRTRRGTYRFTAYRERLALKGARKHPRQLSVPTVRDRLTLRALADVLIATFPESRPKLPQTVVQNVVHDLQTGRYDSFVRIDVQEFYPSLSHDQLRQELSRRIRKPEIHRLIRSAITTPTVPDADARPRGRNPQGVPQGLSISNLLAEIYMRPVDLALRSLGDATTATPGIPPIAYHRYVDDVLILCSESAVESVKETCRKELGDVGLTAHEDGVAGKSANGPLSEKFSYLGYSFGGDYLSVKPENIRRLESRLARHFANWRSHSGIGGIGSHADQRLEWHLNLTITGCVFDGRAYGWIQYFRELTDRELLKRLDWTVMRLHKRYGAPPHLRPKTFTRAHWAVTHPTMRNRWYIPDYGQFDESRQRALLTDYGVQDVAAMTERQVRAYFNRIISKAVRELEADIGEIS